MSREFHEVQRGTEQHQPLEHGFENRPNGMSGHEFNHGFQQMMRAEQHMHRRMEQELIDHGILPPNPFMNGFDDQCDPQQPPTQQQGDSGGGGIFDGIKKVAGVVGKVASIAAIL